MRKGLKKGLLLVLTMILVVGLSSYGLTASSAPVYKLDVFTMLGNYSGEQTGWSAKLFKDKFNLEFNIISSNVEGGGDVKFATMMASGDLGDIVIFGSDTDGKYTDAIKAGYLLDWNKNNLLNKYAPYIAKNYAKAIQKNMSNYGKEKALYGLGHEATDPKNSGSSEGKDMTEHSDLRFDLYQKLGCPEIKSFEDLLPVLKEMQKLEPKSESGRPTYGFTFWKDWDGNMMMYTKAFTTLMGYDEGDGYNDGGFIQFNPDGPSYGCLDPKGPYIRTLKLFNKANQMGLVDPDSISQTFDDVMNKYKDGQLLFCLFPWLDNMYNTTERQNQGKGFQFVPIGGEKVISYAFNPYGKERVIAIGSKAKNPARIMELINWLYTPEGAQTYYYGPKGLTWDINAKGKPVRTEFGMQALPNNPVAVPAKWGGGTFKEGVLQFNFVPIDRNGINPLMGEPYYFDLWTSELINNPTKLVQNWRTKYGALTVKEYLVKHKMIALKRTVYMGKAPENRPETLIQKQGQVATVIKDYSWKCIFAKDDAQFNALLAEMITKAKGLGYDEVLKWNMDHEKQVKDFLKTQK
jgi:putative aldouronate transport system substrate-binding protein